MVRNVRENLILSGMICIAFGAFLSVGGVLSMGAVIGVSGVLLFVIGMSTPSQRTMNEEDIAAWKPSADWRCYLAGTVSANVSAAVASASIPDRRSRRV